MKNKVVFLEEKQQQSWIQSKITGNTRQVNTGCPVRTPNFFAYRLLLRIYVNVEISPSTVNCKLYQIKELKNDFRRRFQANSAAK